jgi:hypothetical protein
LDNIYNNERGIRYLSWLLIRTNPNDSRITIGWDVFQTLCEFVLVIFFI